VRPPEEFHGLRRLARRQVEERGDVTLRNYFNMTVGRWKIVKSSVEIVALDENLMLIFSAEQT